MIGEALLLGDDLVFRKCSDFVFFSKSLEVVLCKLVYVVICTGQN